MFRGFMKWDRRPVGGEAVRRRLGVKEVRRWPGIQEMARGPGSGQGEVKRKSAEVTGAGKQRTESRERRTEQSRE